MASRRVKVDFDIDQNIAKLALEAIPIVQKSTEIFNEEVKSRIDIDEVPSAPGEPPNSTGPYRESWRRGRVRRVGDFVRAVNYSNPSEAVNIKLAAILEYGSREIGIAPRPHVRPAEEARAQRMEAEIARLNAQNRRER